MRKMAVPPHKRSVRADIDTCSLNLALLNLSQPKLGQGESVGKGTDQVMGKGQGRGKGQGCQTYNKLPTSASGGVPLQEGGVSNVLDEVQRLVLKGAIAEAIELLGGVARPNLATSAFEQQTALSKSKAPVPTNIPNSRIDSESEAYNGESIVVDGFMAVLKGCSKRVMWKEARQILLRHMPTAGLRPPTEAWILAMDACAGAGGSEQAIYLLHEMSSR